MLTSALYPHKESRCASVTLTLIPTHLLRPRRLVGCTVEGVAPYLSLYSTLNVRYHTIGQLRLCGICTRPFEQKTSHGLRFSVTYGMKCKYHACNNEVAESKSNVEKVFCNPKCKTKYYVDLNRKNAKIKAILYLGGKCQKCGYDNCITAMEFHHLNPDKKEFSISSLPHTRSWERLKTELDKCELLCCRCHREAEFKLIEANWLHVESYKKWCA